jgi:hypothetical protein
MTEADPILRGHESSLAGRPPGYELMARVLVEHERSYPRTRWQRFVGADPLSPDTRSWFVGALGEQQVSRALSQLGPEWTVLHSVPVGDAGSDIDHILIGPAGVFTINTKHHARATVWVSPQLLMVNGQKTDHLRNARHESARATTLLSAAVSHHIPVRSIIAFAGNPGLTVRQKPVDVMVVQARGLATALRRLKPVYTRDQLALIWAAAAKPATWSAAPLAPVEASTLTAFAALDREVAAAHRRRRLVALLGVIAVTVAIVWIAVWALTSALQSLSASLSSGIAASPSLGAWTPAIVLLVLVAGLRALLPTKRRRR